LVAIQLLMIQSIVGKQYEGKFPGASTMQSIQPKLLVVDSVEESIPTCIHPTNNLLNMSFTVCW